MWHQLGKDRPDHASVLLLLFSEKISGVEGTKLDDEFLDMERKIDVTNKAVAEILSKATEYLQPNPAYRAKLGMLNTVSKIRGQVKTTGYPQTEGLLGDCMLKYGKELGEGSAFGNALIEVGESMKLMAEVKDSLDINVKQTFIDPLQLLQDKDLKEIGHHLKKLEGRRLDYDYKKKRVGKIPDEEVRQAVEKFEESKELAERSMFNFLENDVTFPASIDEFAKLSGVASGRNVLPSGQVLTLARPGFIATLILPVQVEQVSQLAVFIEAALDYHKQSTEILQELQSKLQMRISAASSVPRREYKPRPMKRSPSALNGVSTTSSAKTTGSHIPMDQPCCRGLYEFEPENQGELGFKEGDIITLTNQIDENWYEGVLHGESGFFPINYVEVIVPLPQ
ncbi:endophilin-A3 isoform X1 [Orcinus orca]|uniref:endophilin-A3 isoform X1 n=1 Tax=Orcinus orca TaxID=9733 RepID=UPI0014427E9E|nr:endophilin-A3 isoform X1 [Orcinus orca]XP_033258845.1 endophilin-A3 isoform X1 [Orcinus orca]XP_033258846.1 endophilin-A3 isoform X1 [Orcinus orca]XP_049562830.1 endophilin-A3 isoform X1 [Orcinus orca]